MKKIHPAFLILIVLLLFMGRAALLFGYFFALVLHEAAHAFVARRLGYKLKNLYLLPYGACLMYQDVFFEDDEIKIALAGPVVSLLAAFLTISLWWIFPFLYSFTYEFMLANLALAIFNFLPAYPLDGGRILLNLLADKLPRKQAFKIVTVFNYIFSAMFVCAFVASIFVRVNFNFLIVAIFLLIGLVDGFFQAKYFAMYKTNKVKILKRGVKAKTLAFSSNVPLYKVLKKVSAHKYSVFVVVFPSGKTRFISEDYLKSVLTNFDFNLTFDDIY